MSRSEETRAVITCDACGGGVVNVRGTLREAEASLPDSFAMVRLGSAEPILVDADSRREADLCCTCIVRALLLAASACAKRYPVAGPVGALHDLAATMTDGAGFKAEVLA